MKNILFSAPLVILLFAVGCTDEGSSNTPAGGGTQANGGSTPGGGAGSGGASGSAGDGGSGGAQSGAAGSGTSGSGGQSGASGSAGRGGTGGEAGGGAGDTGEGGEGATGGVGACEPETGDAVCAECRKEHCCDQIPACAGDPTCNDCVACLDDAGDLGMCSEPMGVCPLVSEPGPTRNMLLCLLDACLVECGFN